MNLRTAFAFITSAALLMVAIRYWAYNPPDGHFDVWIQALFIGNVSAFTMNIYGMLTMRSVQPLSESQSRVRSGFLAAFFILMAAQWYVSLNLLGLAIGGAVG